MITYIILLLILLFILTLVIRAAFFRPNTQPELIADSISVNEKKVVDDLSAMIQCRTVSNRDETLVDRTQFKRFETLLEERFPTVYQNSSLTHIGKTGLLFYIRGNSSKKPSVCMAHYDVVPIEKEGWSKPAFDGLVEDGFIWGRGTLDTKGTLCGIMEACEHLLQDGYQPKNDLYLSFSGEEEIDGDTCKDIVSYMEEHNIKPAIVLDEGGAVVDHVFPGVPNECALIGISEKGSVNIEFTMDSKGGHASTPPVHTIVGELASAVVSVEKHPFKAQLTKPIKEMFDIVGRYSTFTYRLIFANLWCFQPILNLLCKKTGGELNAMLRTTCAMTRMEGSKAYNVLPPNASVGMNMRLIGNDTMESAIAYLSKKINNKDIKISIINGMNPSICSDTSCSEWKLLNRVVKTTWPDAIVSPYLMLACSDSRHYCRITDRVYRFSAMKLSKEERAMIHGNDERVPINTMVKTVEFYIRLLQQL